MSALLLQVAQEVAEPSLAALAGLQVAQEIAEPAAALGGASRPGALVPRVSWPMRSPRPPSPRPSPGETETRRP